MALGVVTLTERSVRSVHIRGIRDEAVVVLSLRWSAMTLLRSSSTRYAASGGIPSRHDSIGTQALVERIDVDRHQLLEVAAHRRELLLEQRVHGLLLIRRRPVGAR